jgi:outer membrane protein OmpA-like peptidoglycan-associated protein
MTSKAPFLLAAALTALPGLALAQAVSGPYIDLGAGADLMQNQDFHPSGGTLPAARSYRFDAGPTGEASLGWGFGNGLRAEIECDYTNTHVRGVTFSQPLRAGGYEQQYGGFGNLYYDVPLPAGLPFALRPYLGLGAGYQELALHNVNSGVAGGPAGSVPTDAQAHGGFAYQGIAGIAAPLPFMPGLAMTVEYRMVGLTKPPTYFRGTTDEGAPLYSTPENTFNHEVLIGLRYALWQPAPLPPPAEPSPAAVPAPAPSRTYLVFFDWDKADLTARARQIIADAAQASTHVQTTRIEVNGYTDLSGTARYNMGLSIRRAEAVRAQLMEDGVPEAEIATQGFGETHPLVPTAAGVREPQNRRVEIILK